MSKLELENQLIGWIEFNGIESAARCQGDDGSWFAIPDKCGNMYEVYVHYNNGGPRKWYVGRRVTRKSQKGIWFGRGPRCANDECYMSQEGHERMNKLTDLRNIKMKDVWVQMNLYWGSFFS
uniref:Uncharacterized protein n=1 Tax=Marseillevirus LCMAC102 TaxID=2506603 RepID=A0A481YUV4_9VIRU|nr:MAG: hypothetical protein LCMAC102_03700 [Marseillevirus LCMAC102]